MEICDKCGNTIKEKWNGYYVENNGNIICNECLNKEFNEEK